MEPISLGARIVSAKSRLQRRSQVLAKVSDDFTDAINLIWSSFGKNQTNWSCAARRVWSRLSAVYRWNLAEATRSDAESSM